MANGLCLVVPLTFRELMVVDAVGSVANGETETPVAGFRCLTAASIRREFTLPITGSPPGVHGKGVVGVETPPMVAGVAGNIGM
jgi:hypothetical protein